VTQKSMMIWRSSVQKTPWPVILRDSEGSITSTSEESSGFTADAPTVLSDLLCYACMIF